MCKILVDADACPVKEQIFNVGFRFNVNIILVANSYFRIPETPIIEFKLVDMGFDAADNWIAKNTNLSSIVITSDILLAERCLKIGTFSVISPYGTIFSKQNIGTSISDRAIKADLRGGIENYSDVQHSFGKKTKEKFINLLNKELTNLFKHKP